MARLVLQRSAKKRRRTAAPNEARRVTEKADAIMESIIMTSAEQVRNVLDDCPDLVVEDLADGSAMVCHSVQATALLEPEDQRGFPVTEELHRCADLLADAGFVVALVRGEQGVYLNAH